MYLRETQSPIGDIESPYYVGKGSGGRVTNGRHKGEVRPPKDRNYIEMVATNLSETDAFQLEVLLIYQYGRIDLGTGILRNKTNGGDGAAGYKWTAIRKANHIAAMTGRKKQPMSAEIKLKISSGNLGKVRSRHPCPFCQKLFTRAQLTNNSSHIRKCKPKENINVV